MTSTRHPLLFLVLAIVAMVSATGCRKYLDFEGEDLQPRLVLNGLAHADSTLVVRLSNSRGVIDPGPLAGVTNGQVRVFDEQGVLLEELLHVGEGTYRGSLIMAEGSRLSVEAVAAGLGTVRSTDRIPLAVPILQWDTVSVGTGDPLSGFGPSSVEVTITIADPGERRNHYLLEGFIGQRFVIQQVFDPATGTFVNDTIELDAPSWSRAGFSTTDQVLIAEGDAGLGETRVYFTRSLFRDDVFNGNTRSFRIRLESMIRPGTLDLRLVSISEDAFRYFRTLERYSYAEGDPFAEPVQVFTNVEGGLGIWAGANAQRLIIDLW
jgi:hypothetical protein